MGGKLVGDGPPWVHQRPTRFPLGHVKCLHALTACVPYSAAELLDPQQFNYFSRNFHFDIFTPEPIAKYLEES